MRSFFFILTLLAFAFLFGGCRCNRHTTYSMDRTDTATIDVRFRSLSQLRDTCAEKQTIRIEYYYPNYIGTDNNKPGGSLGTADITDTAANVGMGLPGNPGGGMPAIKSIEITTERNSGSSLTSTTDSSMLSQASTKETQQKEQSSETKPDQGSIFGSTLAIGLVIAVVVAVLFFVGKKYLKANFPWLFTIKKWLDKIFKQ